MTALCACATLRLKRAYKFTGKERDAESVLDNFGARYNASSMGRWMSPDAINITDDRVLNPSNTLNKYIYGGNNPLKYLDLDGRDITVFYYPPTVSGPAGHFSLLASDPATGQSAVMNFGPAKTGNSWVDTNMRLNEATAGNVEGDLDYGTHVKTADELRQSAESGSSNAFKQTRRRLNRQSI